MNNPVLPIIRIKNAWLLQENVSVHLNELWGNGEDVADDEWLEKRVESYKKAWQPYEEKIMRAMTDMLGLSFKHNIIDVYIAPWFNAFSDPLVIGVVQEPDAFVDILTHELLHRLLTDNTTLPENFDLFSEWQKLFGEDHSFGEIVHIPVHAAHKAIYLDVLSEPERLDRDIAMSKDNQSTDYINAWKYVDKVGYREIIEELRSSYSRMAI